MSMKEELKKLKSGDLIFVEPGYRTSFQPGWYEVDSVGRKYIRIFLYNRIQKFDLETGRGFHGDLGRSAYDNGYEYYLHLTEESYRQKEEGRRILSLVRDGLANLKQKIHIDQGLAKDLLEVFKKHGIVND